MYDDNQAKFHLPQPKSVEVVNKHKFENEASDSYSNQLNGSIYETQVIFGLRLAPELFKSDETDPLSPLKLARLRQIALHIFREKYTRQFQSSQNSIPDKVHVEQVKQVNIDIKKYRDDDFGDVSSNNDFVKINDQA